MCHCPSRRFCLAIKWRDNSLRVLGANYSRRAAKIQRPEDGVGAARDLVWERIRCRTGYNACRSCSLHEAPYGADPFIAHNLAQQAKVLLPPPPSTEATWPSES
jgi:hypothetical protein